MRRGLLLAAIGAGLFCGGLVLGWWMRPPRLDARLYARDRLIVVQAHLDEAPADYILIAGDSQAELQNTAARACGRELVNAGVNGVSAALYAELLPSLTVRTRPQAIALTIGTNDILRKNDPLSPEAMARFDSSVAKIVAHLGTLGDRVVVTALPPIGQAFAGRIDPLAVGAYSERLEGLCRRIGCVFTDPFAAIREGDTGFARPGAMRDGLHLKAYRPVLKAMEPASRPGFGRLIRYQPT